ncbi:hypothetical protein BZA05DRAFT_471677 [Tricharina praecox]|uniref:uncharacterized protein n=1 Tax=Tricharina praecox TaxID=43433 RepID=UPI00221E7297|nr:uncharacterized protein BZA05DRAFT_471677 [Tricharina praecox]KAI5855653.1 hypothetical protein BZA05DRAFT_471677 [Tricharina praecox]
MAAADDLLPPPLAQLLPLLHTLQQYTTHITPYIALTQRAGTYLKTADLTTIAALLLIFYLSTMLLGMATRWVLGVVRMFIRLVVVMVVVIGGLWCWQVGVEVAVQRVMMLGAEVRGRVEGWEKMWAGGRGW